MILIYSLSFPAYNYAISSLAGSILEKRAPPQVRAMPKLGESISFWWRKRLVRLSRENKDDTRQEELSQWITCR
jgi:hypothetical protein